jgi:ADP-heptose:LPS heptosyltransferase
VNEITPASIALLQLGRLGDMILTTPLFDALKRVYPDTQLTVIADEATEIIVENHPSVDTVIQFRRGFLLMPGMVRRLFQKRYDLYIDPKDHRSTTSRFIAELVRAERKMVHPSNIGSDRSAIPLPPIESPVHYTDLMLAPLRHLAPGKAFARRPSIHIPPKILAKIDERINPGDAGMVTVNISAGHSSRYWEPKKWEQLIASISAHHNIGVISSPADRALADDICTTRSRTRTVPTTSILEAAAVVARSVAVVSPDTSIIHLASAFNKPTVGLYPPIEWNAVRFAPLSERHRVVMAPTDGSVADIEVEQVVTAVNEVLRK